MPSSRKTCLAGATIRAIFEGGTTMKRKRCFQVLPKGALLIALTLILAAPPLAAGETNQQSVGERRSTAQMEEIVVTATRTEKSIENAPGSTALITKKDMEKRNLATVDEALNTTPGVVLTRGKGVMDKMSSVGLRGIPGQSRTLVLMDGVALNGPYSGALYWTGMNTDDLERIEIVKGPFSSLYGGYAMGGVIHLITRMPDKREFVAKTGYGSRLGDSEAMDDYKKVYLSYGDRIKDKLGLFVSYGYTGTRGYVTDLVAAGSKPGSTVTGWSPTTDKTGANRYLIGDKGHNVWWNDNLTLKARYDFSPATKMTFLYMKSRDAYDYENPETYLRDASGNEVWSYGSVRQSSFLPGGGGSEQNVYNFAFETEVGTAKIRGSAGFVNRLSSWNVTPGTTATLDGGAGKVSDTPAGAYSTELQVSFPAFTRHFVSIGGSFRTGWSKSEEHTLSDWTDEGSKTDLSYKSKGADRTFALFLQDEIVIFPKLTAYLGFRQDWWETFDGYVNQVGSAGYPLSFGSKNASAFSPKAALVYKPFKETTVRGSVGKAFRAPTVYDLYRTWTTSGGVTYAGNPSLKPETTVSWDFGVEQGLWKGSRIRATYFENYIKDLIYNKTITSTLMEKINAGKAESRGVELEMEQRFASWLKLFANFTYTDSEMKENDASPSSVGKRLVDVPRRMLNVGADAEKGRFGAVVVGRYVSKRYGSDNNSDTARGVTGVYDPYFTVDGKVKYAFTPRLSLSLAVNNIFNEEYFSNARAPGRSFFGELTMKF